MPLLPVPNEIALQHSRALQQIICTEIVTSGGWISFARYMELALYAPGMGYYSADTVKFGSSGDLSPHQKFLHYLAKRLRDKQLKCLSSWIERVVIF